MRAYLLRMQFMQDVPSGAAVEESTATFPSMEAALWHPWKLLHQKWTHKLVYVLRGKAFSCAPGKRISLSCLNIFFAIPEVRPMLTHAKTHGLSVQGWRSSKDTVTDTPHHFSKEPFVACAVCADFEKQTGRFPGSGDLDFLRQQARILATGVQADAQLDAKAGTPLPRNLVREDVMPDQALEEYVLGSAELPPVNAVLGGVLANEMLKAVSHKGEPINNMFLFSLADNVGLIETLGEAGSVKA